MSICTCEGGKLNPHCPEHAELVPDHAMDGPDPDAAAMVDQLRSEATSDEVRELGRELAREKDKMGEVDEEHAEVVKALEFLDKLIHLNGVTWHGSDIVKAHAALETIRLWARKWPPDVMGGVAFNDRWHPIATAPTDGTLIILGLSGTATRYVARWWDTLEAWSDDGDYPLLWKPTHWKPLPMPPPHAIPPDQP